ncbi:hypothetical protein ACFSQ7_45910 [Paenibacillus rhizoplanae]
MSLSATLRIITLFAVGKHNIVWTIEKNGIAIEMTLSLPKDEPMELWRVKVTNLSAARRSISIYPYFTIGYMSWMNQSGEYKEALQGIVATAVTPYQKYQDYAKNQTSEGQKPSCWPTMPRPPGK